MGDERGRSRRLVAVLALECSDGARAFVRFAGRFLANGSPPAKMRQAHVPKAERTKRPSASPSNRRSRTQFAALHVHGFAAEVWPRSRRIPTAIQWQTRRVTNRPSEDPGPCRRCAAARSIAADAPTYLSLGSHARSGLRMRRSPRRAVPCGHRNGASLSATDASNPAAWRRGSTHPDHRMRGWIRSLTAGDHRNANGWGLLRPGTHANARIGSSGSTRTLHTRCAAAVGSFVHSLL
jgi:hypothetical protein